MLDIHTHVLPGLDDGAADLDASMAMLHAAFSDGIRTIVGTPHLCCDGPGPSLEQIGAAADRLNAAAEDAGLDIQVRWAGEVRLVEDLLSRIDVGEIPFYDPGGRYLLLEAPFLGDCFHALSEIVFQLRLRDITPVIAHIGRYEFVHRYPDAIEHLVRQGALIQTNASQLVAALDCDRPSLLASAFARRLIHVVASDSHDAVRRPPILSAACECCRREADDAYAELLVSTNPRRILAGEDVSTPEPEVATVHGAPHRARGALGRMFDRWLPGSGPGRR